MWQIKDDGSLVELVDHPPVDESMIEPVERPPKGPRLLPPRDLQVTKTTSSGIVLRWQASPQATFYVIEWSEDGKEFSTVDYLEGEDAQPDSAGFCSYSDQTPSESDAFYRVRACQSLELSGHSEPSRMVKVNLGRTEGDREN